ncbi:mannose-1-phosphate guanylyltransferase [Geobacter pelophilus]|uniref:mannose-1-phosphate guanylyltransferase n=1 Tax=Geoanaerobacter pelophilus TaxID=60036 RepID=A0AAW4L057_9BACT|nr:mannose-1-phosphate guanylyltransferase [Geoanaerobacter pelophilus]MBT0663180.1 mannose-1-phosphate guanylyltransferase [Geoanaerobacter pelophilus]
MYAVILAGGSGTRFWPLSRKRTPKQLMSVFGGRSMLQRTIDRVLPLKPKRILVITNAEQAAATAEQLAYVKGVPLDIIAEPVGRNTAPAIGLAAAVIARHDSQGVMVVLPADHFIADEERFRATLLAAREPAFNGYLVTLGITPDRPETGYGYIEADKAYRGAGPYPVKRFVEKPNLEKALEYLEAGSFYWNSGMFLWRADTILEEMSSHMPELYRELDGLDSGSDIWEIADLKPQIEAIYGRIASESIDYGIMEKSEKVEVLPAEFGWSDVGSWSAMPALLEADTNGNVAMNDTRLIAIDAKGCLVNGSGKLVALVGVSDLAVVNTDDALLVCPLDRAQDVKKVVEELERQGKKELL